MAETLSPAKLTGPALRLRSRRLLDVFAEVVLPGTSFSELHRTLTSTGAPPVAATETAVKRRWLAALARVLALADGSQAGDRESASLLYDALVERAGPDDLDADDQMVYAQSLFVLGRYERCRDQLPQLQFLPDAIAHYLRCDLAGPATRDDGEPTGEWLALLNQPFQDAGLESIAVGAEATTWFDRMESAATPATELGRLVTVVMTAFRPGEPLLTSVRSILRQTWRELELIIVDDASGPEYDDVLDTCERLDPRVTVMRQEVNGGTYAARNTGLSRANGEFVTFQDSDDWSHPRRIEHQLAPMLNDPSQFATRSRAVRAQSDLTHQWIGYEAQRTNASSLMIRRAPVLERIGYFDEIRKGADFEYALRMETAFDAKIHDVNEPLAYTRLRAGSLSRADFARSWAAPGRIAHQAAYRQWHRQIKHGTAVPYLAAGAEVRPFPLPEPDKHYDVVLVDDWRPGRGPYDAVVDEIKAITAEGLSVGIASLEAPGEFAEKRSSPGTAVQELVNAGEVDRVLLTDPGSAEVVVVRDPVVLQFAPTGRVALDVGRVVVLRPPAPAVHPTLSVAFNQATCNTSALDLFGRWPTWADFPMTLKAYRGASSASLHDHESEGADPAEVANIRHGWQLVDIVERLGPLRSAAVFQPELAAWDEYARSTVHDLKPWPGAEDHSVYRNTNNRVRYRRTLDLITRDATIFDVGFGRGYLCGLLLRDRDISGYHGIDVERSYVGMVAGMCEANGLPSDRVHVREGDIYQLDRAAVDATGATVVVCCEVLEHLPDPEKALAVLADALPEGTDLIFSVPLYGRLERVWGHTTVFDAARLKSMCDGAGLVVHGVEPVANTWTFVVASRSTQPSPRVAAAVAATPQPRRAPHGDYNFQTVPATQMTRGQWLLRTDCEYDQATEGAIRCAVTGHDPAVAGKQGQYAGVTFPVDDLRALRLRLDLPPSHTIERLYVDAYRGTRRTARWRSSPALLDGGGERRWGFRAGQDSTGFRYLGNAGPSLRADRIEVFVKIAPGSQTSFTIAAAYLPGVRTTP